MPKNGMDMKEGVLLRWLKNVGDRVEKDEAVMEIETDKVTMESEAPASGVLLARYFEEGDVIPVLTVMGYIGEAGEAVPKPPTAPRSLRPPFPMRRFRRFRGPPCPLRRRLPKSRTATWL
jgi:pyruvate dehydrogenase E2 component (dihydrolipoamide acetyltransferase)